MDPRQSERAGFVVASRPARFRRATRSPRPSSERPGRLRPSPSGVTGTLQRDRFTFEAQQRHTTDTQLVSTAVLMRGADRAFQQLFRHLFVYNMLFEDTEVDELFLGVGPDSRILGISGAGCGIANHVSRRPRSIDAVDINA